jgi:tetratricopeptide (TPR) repeat protein
MTATSTARSREQTRRAAIELHRKGDLAGAEQRYRTLLAQDPQDVGTLYLMGVLRFQQGDHGAAEDILRTVLAVQRAPEALAQMGQILAARGRHAEALDLYREAETRMPDVPDLQTNLGVTLLAIGRREEAIAAFRAAIVVVCALRRNLRSRTKARRHELRLRLLPENPQLARHVSVVSSVCASCGARTHARARNHHLRAPR